MASPEEEAWWDGLPDQIEDWDAPPPMSIASQSTGRSRFSGEKASLRTILVKADRNCTGLTSPAQAAGVGRRGEASEPLPVGGQEVLGEASHVLPAVQQKPVTVSNVAPIVSSLLASTQLPGAYLHPPVSASKEHMPQNGGQVLKEQPLPSNAAPPIPPAHGDRAAALSEKQRNRIEANRIAALRRRNAATWFQAAHMSPGIQIPPFQQTAPCQVTPPVQISPEPQPSFKGIPSSQLHSQESMAPTTHVSEEPIMGRSEGFGGTGEAPGRTSCQWGEERDARGFSHMPSASGGLPGVASPLAAGPSAKLSGASHTHMPSLQACNQNGRSVNVTGCGGGEVNREKMDGSGTELQGGEHGPEPGINEPSDSPDFEVPDDFWDDVHEPQGGTSGGTRQTSVDLSGANGPAGVNSLPSAIAPAGRNRFAEGVFIDPVARGGELARVQPGVHSHQRVLPAFCTGAPSHQPGANQLPQPFQQPLEPLNIPVTPQGPRVTPRPLEVHLELHTVDLFRVSVQYAFCDPPFGTVFAPDPFENPEERTRSVVERACPGVVPQKWVCEESLDSGGYLVFPMREYDAILRALSKLPDAKTEGIPESTMRGLRARWGPPETAGSIPKGSKEEVTKRSLGEGGPSGNQSPPPPIKRPCDGSWRPLKSWHIGDEEVDALMEQGLPAGLRKMLLPFQWEGVRYGLRRGGRCLIADEMGVGKTIQVGKIEHLLRSRFGCLMWCIVDILGSLAT